MTREEYNKVRKEEMKDLILRIVDVFYACDGDFTKISKEVDKTKSRISSLLKSKYVDELISEGKLTKEEFEKIRSVIEKNKINGSKKGGNSFKEKYDVEYNDEHRIIGHKKR